MVFQTGLAKKAVLAMSILTASGLASGCSVSVPSDSRASSSGIIGGAAVGSNEPIAAMTAMLIDTNRGALCTASIVGDEWILTAGHCVIGAQVSDLQIVFAGTFQDFENSKTPKKEMRSVKATFIHPKYPTTVATIHSIALADQQAGKHISSSEIDNIKDWGDIALVQLSGRIPSEKKIANFLTSNVPLAKGDSVVLAGYGQVSADQNSDYGSLREVSVAINDAAWGSTEVLVDNQTKGACHGDSGGPAYATVSGRLLLFGVTSHGVGEDTDVQCTHLTSYTNAVNYQQWISSTMSAN